jgi:hypothetical protein
VQIHFRYCGSGSNQRIEKIDRILMQFVLCRELFEGSETPRIAIAKLPQDTSECNRASESASQQACLEF